MDAKQLSKETSAPKPELMRAASEVRAQANRMSDAQREAALRHGMQLIYGGSGPHGIAAKTGRP